MLTHFIHLRFTQLVRLVENGVRNAHLAHIMQWGSLLQQFHFKRFQSMQLCKSSGIAPYPLYMATGLPGVELGDGAQQMDHILLCILQLAVELDIVGRNGEIVPEQLDQVALGGIKEAFPLEIEHTAVLVPSMEI